MNRVLLIVFACISFNMSTAQSSINDYKYVIVEDQFNFQSEPGQYNLNGLVHFLLRKHGFTSIIEGQELPADLKANFCLALRADVTVKGALRTRAAIVFKDCESNEIYRTAEGVTKEKDFARAYDLAIRKTSESLKSLNYVYTPNQNIIEKGRPEEVIKVVEQAKNEIEELKAEIKELKENRKVEESIVEKSKIESEKEMISQKEIVEDVQPEKQASNWYDKLKAYSYNNQTYYEKPGSGGLYFVNAQNEVKFKLQTLSRSNVFILTFGTYKGVAFYDESMKDYTLQYYNDNGELETKILKLN